MDIKQLSLSDIINNIKNNQYEIPDFQRDFVWKPENITLLLDSIFKNYPIGALLTLSSTNIKLSSEKLNVKSDFTLNNSIDSFYVLDGQQRLTSIARAFFQGDDKHSYYLDMEIFCLFCISEKQKNNPNKYLDYTYSGETIFEFSKTRNHSPAVLGEKLIRVDLLRERQYDDPKIFDFDSFLTKYFLPKYQISTSSSHEIKAFVQEKISSTFYSYKLIIQQLDKDETIDAICRIFETINHTGVKLTILDLLVAKTYNKDFNLRQVEDKLKSRIESLKLKEESLLYLFLGLKQLTKGQPPIFTRENLFNLKDADFNDRNFNAILSAIDNFKKWKTDSRIHSRATLDTLNILLIIIESKRILDGEVSLFSKYKNLIEKIMFSRSFSKLPYNKPVIANDYKIMSEIFKLDPQDVHYKYYHEQLFKDYLIPKISATEVFETSYKQKLSALILSILYKDIYLNLEGFQYDDISLLEEHHIVPKKTCQQYGLDKNSTNSVANILLIDGLLNRQISDSNPDIYLSNLLLKHNDPNIFDKHKLLVISNNLKDNFIDYKKFIEQRALVLSEMFNEYIERNQLVYK